MPPEVRYVGVCGGLAAVAGRVGAERPEPVRVPSAAGAQGDEPGVVEAHRAGRPGRMPDCAEADLDADMGVNLADVGTLQQVMTGG